MCSRRNQRRSSGFLDALPALVWTPLQTDMKFTLGGSIVSISRFNRAEGNNEGLYSGSDIQMTLGEVMQS